MIEPARIDLEADRWVAFIRSLAMIGSDLTDATFAMQVRLTPDATGSALVSLTTVTSASAEGVRLIYGGTATVAEHITAGRLPIDFLDEGLINPATNIAYVGTDSLALSLIGVRINETTIEGLPFPAERGDDPLFYWDMHITPDGSIKDKYAGGEFKIRAGVTQ